MAMKRFLSALLAVVIVLSLSGCMISYEDTNGDADFSLQTITEQDIIQKTICSKVMSSTVTADNRTVCKAKTMSGVEALFEKRMKNESLDIVVSCQITKGNARLVLTLDDKIVHDFALNEENQRFTLDNVTGRISLKLAGESTGYAVSYELQ